MSDITPQSDDILGTRPAGEGRAGAAQLLRAGLGLLRQHGLRAWGLAFLALAIQFVISLSVFSPLMIGSNIANGLRSAWWWHITMVASLVTVAPFMAAYAYALLLLLQQRRAGAKTLFSPFRSIALLANVVIAASAPLLVQWLIPWFLQWIPWSEIIYSGLVAGNSLLAKTCHLVPIPEWVLANCPKWLGILLAAPFAWSALHVLVLGTPGLRAIAQSVRLTIRYWRLAALYLAAARVLLPLTLWVLPPLMDLAAAPDTDIARGILCGLATLCSLLIWGVNVLLEALILVLVYREMIWREREAQSPPLDSPARAP